MEAHLNLSDPVTVEKIRFAGSRTVSLEALDTLREVRDLELFVRDVAEGIAVELRGHVYAEKLAEQEVTEVVRGYEVARFPSGVWQHAKGKFAPRWFLRRWPVVLTRERLHWQKTVRVRTQQFASFPEHKIKTPENLRGPVVVRHERSTIL